MIRSFDVCGHVEDEEPLVSIELEGIHVRGCGTCVTSYLGAETPRYNVLRLARTFPALRAWEDFFEPWSSIVDVLAQARHAQVVAPGAAHAVAFLANIAHLESPTGDFDALRAIQDWEGGDRHAYLEWASDPWWVPQDMVVPQDDDELVHHIPT